MRRWVVFYAGLVYGEYDWFGAMPYDERPDGGYTYNSVTKKWYVIRNKQAELINLVDVPKELLVWITILS